MGDGGIAAFLEAVRAVLPAGRVLIGDAIGPIWRLSTEPWATQPLAVVQPATDEHARVCVAAAGAHGVALHPVSRGRSWGLGTRLPPSDAVILDLSGLDSILELDVDRGTARIGPGVTFEGLQAALLERGLHFHVPGFGGPPDASVLANALERGDGLGAMGDRFAHLWDLDVVLSTGERFQTGFSRYGSPATSRIHPRPVGPLVEGLFSQSGFGVVLSGRVGLAPTMPHVAMVTVEIGTSEALSSVLGDLANLIWGGVVAPMSCSLWDNEKRYSTASGRRAPAADRDRWWLTIAVGGLYPAWLDLQVRTIQATFEAAAASIRVDTDLDDNGQRTATGLTGFPDRQNLTSAYVGKPHAPDVAGDLAADRCGLLWLCPAVALSGVEVLRLAAIVRDETAGTPIAPSIGYQATSARALHAFVSLAWDRDNPGADEAATRCHDNLVARLAAEAMIPYRASPATIATLGGPPDDFGAVLGRLRAALDPRGVLSPGKVPEPR